MAHLFDVTTPGLERFLDAQAPAYDEVVNELRQGKKQTHWMWFIFPQIRGLGISPTAQYYAISGLDEARAYLAHPLLGPRLLACTAAVTAHRESPLTRIFGMPDDLKFRSSMTLFELAAEDPSEFSRALDTLCAGERDEITRAIVLGHR